MLNSLLLQAIKDGIDPHSFTASMFKGIPLEEFMALKNSDNEEDRENFRYGMTSYIRLYLLPTPSQATR